MDATGVLNSAFRSGLLRASTNGLVQRFVSRYGMSLGAARFVAGENLSEAVETLKRLEGHGLKTNTTLLGEHVRDPQEAEIVKQEYLTILDTVSQEGLSTNIAVKLTHLGLDLGKDVAHQNVQEIVERASAHKNSVRIDMEDSTYVDDTLAIFTELRQSGYQNVGTVLQSYLYRSESDLRSQMEYCPNLRLVKGAYLEPSDVAYPDKRDVDHNYIRMAEYALQGCGYTAIATHDEKIIDHVIEFTHRHDIPRGRFEFQMLYGVATDLQLELVKRGYAVLTSTNYGPDWYPYLMRRLAERPANLLFLARNVMRQPFRRSSNDAR